jgi:hypothetical protein
MDRRSVVALGLALGAGLASPALAQRQRPWRTIFDGRSLTGWTPIGDANWSLADGAAQADKGTGFLVSDETFGDFEVRAEIWVDTPGNSGVFIRCTNPMTVTAANAYEVNVRDTATNGYGTGSIVNVAKVEPVPQAGGRWNVLQARADGEVLDVWLNGTRTVMGARDKGHAHGRIALQYGAGVVKFRRVQVRAV